MKTFPFATKLLCLTIFLILLISGAIIPVSGQPTKVWDKTFGSSGLEGPPVIVPSQDGGFLIGGYSQGTADGDRTVASRGRLDFWVLKIDAGGNKLWDNAYGGTGTDILSAIVPTDDGGYLLAGSSDSEISGEQTQAGMGGLDFWIVRIDAEGRKLWDRRFGSSENDVLKVARPLPETGFFLLGRNGSSGNPGDAWALRLDSDGNVLWEKRALLVAGGDWDPFDAILTADGGIQVGALLLDSDYSDDLWVERFDNLGNWRWGYDFIDGLDLFGRSTGSSLHEFSDGAVVMMGSRYRVATGYNFWFILLRLDAFSHPIITRGNTYFAPEDDYLSTGIVTAEGLLLAGYTKNDPGLWVSEDSRGVHDFWLMQIDTTGEKIWDKRFGGSNLDICTDVIALDDGGYLLAGQSWSDASGDKSQNSKGSSDFWIIKTSTPSRAIIDITGPNGTVRFPAFNCETIDLVDHIVPCDWLVPLPQPIDFNLQPHFKFEKRINSVRFTLNGIEYIDNEAPFRLFDSDFKRNKKGSLGLKPGSYKLEITAFSNRDALGNVVESYSGTIQFTRDKIKQTTKEP